MLFVDSIQNSTKTDYPGPFFQGPSFKVQEIEKTYHTGNIM